LDIDGGSGVQVCSGVCSCVCARKGANFLGREKETLLKRQLKNEKKKWKNVPFLDTADPCPQFVPGPILHTFCTIFF
jgi:hypothetical protein